MARTGHGHHIPGTLNDSMELVESPVACGGTQVCPKCKQDIQEYVESTTMKIPVYTESRPSDPIENWRQAGMMVRGYMDHYILSTAKVYSDLPSYQVQMVSYEKVFKNWRVIATIDIDPDIVFVVQHDSSANETRMNVCKNQDTIFFPG